MPFVRGRQRSRAIGDILAEVQSLAAAGVVEVTLLGQNVNTYGRDLETEGGRRPLFAELLRVVNQVDGIRRIRFTSPHPHDFTPDVIEAMAESDNVCEHIHFPLQSGSDRVLQAMRRSYRSERYLDWLDRIRIAIPGIAVSTDIIVGFPGETEEDFGATLAVVERAGFDSAFTFQYSPRPGTRAATMDEQVPKEVVQERFDRLVELQTRITAERNAGAGGHRRRGTRGRCRQEGRLDPVADADQPDRAPPDAARAGHVCRRPDYRGRRASPPRRGRHSGRAGRGVMLRALVGPTASGKTEAGIALARALGAEVVSVDSMLVYRGMDIGTAKPTPAEQASVPHHLLDLAEPSERFTVARFQAAATEVLDRVATPVLVGGSGLYFRAVVDRLRFPRRIPRSGRRSRPRPTHSGPTSSSGGWPRRTPWRPIAWTPPTSVARSGPSR